MVRGLDYYTRTAFEFVSTSLSAAQATLFGGGRYDGLAEALGGPHVPGVGFGMGLERVLQALEEEGVSAPESARLDCFVIAVGDQPWSRATEVVRELRAHGLHTDGSFEPASVKHQFRTADRLGARFAVVIGERELAAGTVTARRLDDGEERTGRLDELTAWIGGQGS
jgi:histidyl-tRNA synthetase